MEERRQIETQECEMTVPRTHAYRVASCSGQVSAPDYRRAGEVAQDAEAVAGGKRKQIEDGEHQVAGGELRSEARDKQDGNDQQEIHERARSGDEDFVASAGGVGALDVGATQLNSQLAHRHFEGSGGEHVPQFVEQKAGENQSAERKTKLPSAAADAENNAEKNKQPTIAMHAERDFKSRHASHPLHSY